MNYKISIIIPCYNILNWQNGQIYLENAIKSLKKQSIGFENLDIILIDDCSEDATKDLLLKYEEKYENIKVILAPEHKGTGYSRHLGVQHSSSEYIMFLDADDEYSSESCEKLYNTITEKNADIVSSNYITRLNGVNYVGFNYDEKYKEFSPKKSLKKFQKQYAIWARIYKKELIKDIYIETNVLEDIFFNFKSFFESEKVIYLNDFFSCIHNVNYDSITMKPTVNSMTKAFAQIETIINLIEKYSKSELAQISCDLFSIILQDMLSYNFSIKENKELLSSYKDFKENIEIQIDEKDFMRYSSFLIRFVDFFVKNNKINVVSLFIRPIQLMISNKKIYKFLFKNFKNHEEYKGKI